LQRAELRRAVSYSIDREAIVNQVYLGAATPVWGPITPGHGRWHVPDLPRETPDLDRARSLLAEVGLRDANGDGTLEDVRGTPARFTILTQKGHTIRERVVAALQEQLRRVGFTVDVVALDAGTLLAQYKARDFDAMYFGVESNTTDPSSSTGFWMSSGLFHFWDPLQKTPGTPWEARIDDLMRQQGTTRDAVARQRIFADVQRIHAEERPTIHVAAPQVTIAIGSRVAGATPAVLQPPVLWNAEVLGIRRGAGGTQ
jgi:peptide/nickel transport system substrate-binding protein